MEEKINSILISWEKRWMKEKGDGVKLQSSAPCWLRMCDYAIHWSRERLLKSAPYLHLLRRRQDLWSWKEKCPGGVESSVRQQPWSPSSLQIYLHPSSSNFGVPVPSPLPVLPNSRCVLLCQLLLPDSFPTALSVSQPLDSRLATGHGDSRALRLSRKTPGSHRLSSRSGAATC